MNATPHWPTAFRLRMLATAPPRVRHRRDAALFPNYFGQTCYNYNSHMVYGTLIYKIKSCSRVLQSQLDNTAKCCGIMAVLHITYYDIWPWPMTMTTNVAKECKNEKHKNNLTQSSKCLKNFNFPAVTVFEIRYEISHIYTRVLCAPETPLAKKIWGSQLYIRGATP